MTDKKREADLEAAKNVTLDEMADAAAEICEAEHAEDISKIDLNDVRLTLAGDPLPIDPETGEIDVDKLTDEQREEMKAAIKAMAETFAELSPGMKSLKDSYTKLGKQIIKSSGADRFQELFNALKESISTSVMRDVLQGMNDDLQAVQDLIDEIDELKTFIEAELKKGEYGGLSFDNILQDYTPRELLEMQSDPDSTIYKLFEAARKAKAAALPVISNYKTNAINTPVDRVNFLTWNDFKDTGGQIKLNLMSEKDKRNPERSKLDISARFSLSFSDDPGITTTKELNHFDRRLQQAADTILSSGQDIVLIGDLYYAMGGKTAKPSENQRDKIIKSLTKQRTATIYIDNAKEASEYDYPHFEYEGSPLATERVRVRYAGREVEAVRIISRPPLMRLADERDQLSKVSLKVLQSGISQTNNNLRIEDYLIYRILRQKNVVDGLYKKQQKRYTQQQQKQIKESSCLTILLETFYKRIDAANKKAIVRERALKTAHKLLDHYTACGFIKEYEIDEDRIKIQLPKK